MHIADAGKPFDKEEYHRNYYQANKEKASAKAKERYQKNKEEIKKKSRDRYQENPEKFREQGRKRYENNKEKSFEQTKKWVQNNKEKRKSIQAKYRQVNRDEIRGKGREYAAEHREEQNAYRKKWRSNPDNAKDEKLKDYYGISLKDFNGMMLDQNGLCGICCKKFKRDNPNGLDYPCIDHDHGSKNIRGILCRRCNSGIGGFHDDKELLSSAFLWLTTKTHNRTSATKPVEIFVPPQKKYYLKREFKITVEQFISMVALQDCKCGICDKPFLMTETKGEGSSPFNIDHCHTHGTIRGVLCPLCNKALGLLKDDPEIIQNAIKWLEKGLIDENS